jgi:hypothetical protein
VLNKSLALSRRRAGRTNAIWTDLVPRWVGIGLSYKYVDALTLSSSFSTLLVSHRVMKDSQLSQHGHAILFLPFVIAIFDTLGLDLILDGPAYERHSRVPTQGGSLSYDLFFCRALRSERGSKGRRHLPCAPLRWFAARLSALVDA